MQLNTTGNMLPEVLDFFYDNGTAYCVIKHIDTVKYTLNEYFVRNKTISEKMSVCMLRDICNALIAIHGAGLMHGNIEPLNIVHTPETTFLASCDFLQTFDNNTGIAYSGFSPIEMYTSKVKKGPYTDIYMLGATFYYAVTGEKLLDAVERMSGKAEVEFDRFLKLTPRFKEILKKCVEVKIEDRYQSAEELLADLSELNRDYYKSLYETISCLYHFDGHSGSGGSSFTSGGCVNLVYSKCNHVLYKESEFYGLNCISGDSVISYYDLPESVRSKEDIIRYAKLKEYYRY